MNDVTRRYIRRSDALPFRGSLRAGTRHELLRRVDWATDFIMSHYSEPITLDHIAGAARLSKFHLLRALRLHLGASGAHLREAAGV